MTLRLLLAIAAVVLASAGEPPLTVAVAGQAPATTAFDGTRAWDHLTRMVEIGPRPAGSPALRQTRAYITRQLRSMDLTVQEQPFTAVTPAGRTEMVNLVVRLPGNRPDRILLAGHYDTKLMRNDVFVGANDGGSSAALLIELARALAGRPREFTHELIWFDGEEATCFGWTDCGTSAAPDHTYGSRHYVDEARRAGALPTLRALVLVDMVADRDLRFRRDANSTPWLVDIIWDTARRLGHADVFTDSVTSVEDDHLPFLRARVPAVDIIDLDYAPWHTPADTLEAVDPRGLQIVGDVVLEALPVIERRLQQDGR